MILTVQVAGIVKNSIVDGPGIRYAVFVQGCPHNCPGCHNPQTHPFEGGRQMDPEEIFQDFRKDSLVKGITLSGGEPFCQSAPLAELAGLVHGIGKDVVVYTGYTWEQLAAREDRDIQALLEQADLLIDGPFLLARRNLELSFRGSENQRILDMAETRRQGKAVLWEP